MENLTHTPGPWTALNRGYKSHVTDNDMNWNAEIVGPGHAANALLIAAAPELLEALQEFVGAVNAGAKFSDMSVVEYARTAIAKAKGE